MKFTRPDQLPETAAELTALAEQAKAEINVFQARRTAGEFTLTGDETPEQKAQIKADIERLEYLTSNYTEIDGKATEAAAEEKGHAERLDAALAAANAATAPKPAPEPEAPKAPAEEAPVQVPAEAAAEVVAEAEAAVADAAAPAAVTAAAPAPVSFAGAAPAGDLPKPEVDEKLRKPFLLASTAPNFAQHDGQYVDTAVIAEGLASKVGQFTGLQDGVPTILATMKRPQGKVFESHDEFLAELDRVTSEIPGHGPVSARALAAAGGWCAPSEQQYGFDPTQPAVGLLSFPEMNLPRGGIIIPSEPDFTSLQTGFHFTESQLEATDGGGQPTALKTPVEVPCATAMTEYRKEVIGWAVKSGVLQDRAWPELIKKFLDEFLVAHQQRISAKSLIKVLGMSSAAKVVPNDVVLGATTGILNGLHQRAKNIQIRTRKKTVGGIAPIFFRDVLRADAASRDDFAGLSTTDAQVDAWLAERDIYLQYEGTWQSLGAGQPGHYDTNWWPGSVDVVLFPAGAFWRTLNNVMTVGAMYDIDMLTQNRHLLGFVEDEFQVGIRPSDVGSSHLIRIPLCVNGAVGAREHIDCSTEYNATITKTVSLPGSPTSGGFALKFGPLGIPSAAVNFNGSAGSVDTALTGIDDGVTAAGDIVTTGGPLPAAVTVTYPARLGDLQVGTSTLAGGTSQTVSIS